MPGHIHLVISESERSTPSTVMQVVKQRYARHLLHKKRRKPVDAGSDSVLGIFGYLLHVSRSPIMSGREGAGRLTS